MGTTFTRIYLIRHGEVVNVGPKQYTGHRDVDLSANGLSQMEQMAKRLADCPIVAVYCSDLVRTTKGAEILARSKGIPIYPRQSLREKNFGAWEGLTYEEVAARFPRDWEVWLADPAGSRPLGGETIREVEQRVLQELSLILKKHWGEEVVILSHGGPNRVILCHALGLDLKHIFRIEQKYAALNIIDFFENDMATVQLMNG
jgi:alpha-ribazole phosphatase/probable phosphoglycerate mutase